MRPAPKLLTLRAGPGVWPERRPPRVPVWEGAMIGVYADIICFFVQRATTALVDQSLDSPVPR